MENTRKVSCKGLSSLEGHSIQFPYFPAHVYHQWVFTYQADPPFFLHIQESTYLIISCFVYVYVCICIIWAYIKLVTWFFHLDLVPPPPHFFHGEKCRPKKNLGPPASISFMATAPSAPGLQGVQYIFPPFGSGKRCHDSGGRPLVVGVRVQLWAQVVKPTVNKNGKTSSFWMASKIHFSSLKALKHNVKLQQSWQP